jgi:hypothetical protein
MPKNPGVPYHKGVARFFNLFNVKELKIISVKIEVSLPWF